MSDVNMEQMPDLGRFVDYVWSLKAERDQLRAELAEYQEDTSYVTACETIRKLRAEVAMLRSYEGEWERSLNQLRAEADQFRELAKANGDALGKALAELEAANKRADINAWNHRHAKQDLQTARNRIAELEAIRGQPSPALIEAVRDLIGAANSVNRSRMYEVRGHDDDQPRYWQRKEWVDWLVENGEKAQQALDALPPQQADAWPTLDKPAKVGPVRFHAGLSARLVVEAAQRQHEYSQQPEVEAARMERFKRAMREFQGEQPDAVSVPRDQSDVPLYAAIERACGELPDGWSIEVGAERGGAWVTLYNAEMEEVEFPTDNERLDYTVKDAVEFAILSTKNAEEGE